jgi:hypothetical protein
VVAFHARREPAQLLVGQAEEIIELVSGDDRWQIGARAQARLL